MRCIGLPRARYRADASVVSTAAAVHAVAPNRALLVHTAPAHVCARGPRRGAAVSLLNHLFLGLEGPLYHTSTAVYFINMVAFLCVGVALPGWTSSGRQRIGQIQRRCRPLRTTCGAPTLHGKSNSLNIWIRDVFCYRIPAPSGSKHVSNTAHTEFNPRPMSCMLRFLRLFILEFVPRHCLGRP